MKKISKLLFLFLFPLLLSFEDEPTITDFGKNPVFVSMDGRVIKNATYSSLSNGVYIVKTENGVVKIIKL